MRVVHFGMTIRPVIMATGLALTACPGPRERGTADTVPARLPSADNAGPVFGAWTVVGFRTPGVSAMSADEAARWKGRTIELSPQSAAIGADACDTPGYETITAPADSLLATDYRIAPAALGLPAGGTLDLTRVTCSGEAWLAPGGVLLHAGQDRAFTVWDGTFFELERK